MGGVESTAAGTSGKVRGPNCGEAGMAWGQANRGRGQVGSGGETRCGVGGVAGCMVCLRGLQARQRFFPPGGLYSKSGPNVQ